jgi:hypothetical protein
MKSILSSNTSVIRVCLVLVATSVQFNQLTSRGIDPDELEHLHAAYCVHRGMVPYRDFFEHHTPALYYVVQPLFQLDGLSVLWGGRLLMWFCSLGTLCFTALAGRRIAGTNAGLLAAALLAWSSIFFAKGIELRPDVPATLLLTIALWLCVTQAERASWRRGIISGLLLGLATLFTQKAVVPASGIVLGLFIASRSLVSAGNKPATDAAPTGSSRAASLLARLAGIAAGGLLIWIVALVPFAQSKAASPFVESTIVRLFHWSVRSPLWDYLRPALLSDTTIWCAAALGILFWLGRFLRRGRSRPAESIVVGMVLASVLSVFWVKARYSQYYLLWYPALCIAAAKWLRVAARLPVSRGVLACDGTVLIGLAALFCVTALRAVMQGADGALGHLYDSFRPLVATLLIVGPAAAIALVACLFLARKRHRAAVTALALFGFWYAGARHLDAWFWSNSEQVAAIEAVNRKVPPDGTVLDGFTGYGALRRHAWYYWWLNDYSFALVAREQLEIELNNQLIDAPPDVILFDENLQRLPADLTDWIRANYRPDGPAPIWVRRGREGEAPNG